MRGRTVVLLTLVSAATAAFAGCTPSAAGGGDGGGDAAVALPAETLTWCGENMRKVYKAATEISANPRLEELDRQVLSAGLEGREIAPDIGNRLRDEWIAADAAGFARACERAFP